MIVREATHDDVSAIARVYVDAWRTTYRDIIPDEYLAKLSYENRENSWKKIISKASDSNFTYVAENELGQIIGFANGGLERENDPVYQGELYAIYILESARFLGVGRCLFKTVVKRLNRLGIDSLLVWVLKDNSACRFYEKLGGKSIREKQIARGGKKLTEVAYGWSSTVSLINSIK